MVRRNTLPYSCTCTCVSRFYAERETHDSAVVEYPLGPMALLRIPRWSKNATHGLAPARAANLARRTCSRCDDAELAGCTAPRVGSSPPGSLRDCPPIVPRGSARPPRTRARARTRRGRRRRSCAVHDCTLRAALRQSRSDGVVAPCGDVTVGSRQRRRTSPRADHLQHAGHDRHGSKQPSTANRMRLALDFIWMLLLSSI